MLCYNHSWSFKVIEIGTNRKPICDFRLDFSCNYIHVFYWCTGRKSPFLAIQKILPTLVSLDPMQGCFPGTYDMKDGLKKTTVPGLPSGENCMIIQTLICVLVARPRRCLKLSNPVPWQNWMAAYLGYTLRMKTLFRGWPVMAHESWNAYEKKKIKA